MNRELYLVVEGDADHIWKFRLLAESILALGRSIGALNYEMEMDGDTILNERQAEMRKRMASHSRPRRQETVEMQNRHLRRDT